MNSIPTSRAFIPLPAFSPSIADADLASSTSLRQFGTNETDLAIDFAGTDPHALITRILEQCTLDPESRLSAGFFRELSVGKRLECLLLLAADEVGPAFSFPFHCTSCSQELELELTLDEIAGQQR